MSEIAISACKWEKRWPAPAKLNLMLRIVGRRADGYHLLQTVFHFVDLCDWIIFTPRSDGEVRLKKTLPEVAEEDDLTVRAAKLLKKETGYSGGVTIDVEKNLPMGGGLGGGSSDAATTLVVLNHLWELGLSKEKLMQIGLQLGADVPVFVFGKSAWAEGVGEVLSEITIPESFYLILKPDCHVNTREIFLAKDLTRDSKSINISDFLAGQCNNDCLEIVRKLYPSVGVSIQDLSEFSVGRLTGTGACVFAQFESETKATEARLALKDKWQVYLAKGLNSSPLYLSLYE
jgi:4-diphosphocytidyl-2-C-methyl-D-erythritol kinase